MATLVLTAVGSAIGGPIGGAIGAALGQRFDNMLFAPKGRQGPRLKELEIQTSSYGTAIPAIFGAMRVAGTVIWATDLVERRSKGSGGKGKPSTTEYSYSVSMAVALSSKPISRIGRIWADGNLLRGAGGDFKVDTMFRLHTGHDDQKPDPLIASAESAGQCPAYRGFAYAVFEDLQLGDYGNRIPSLTFEIFERETPVPINAIFEEASSANIEATSSETVFGYALSGTDTRSAVSPILDNFPVVLCPASGKLQLLDRWMPTVPLPAVQPVAQGGSAKYPQPSVTMEPAFVVPHDLSVRYFEPARDYQAGKQSSERGGAGRTSQQIDLPAALSAAAAKRIAELHLLEKHCVRESWVVQAAMNSEAIYAGQWISDPEGRPWRIVELEHGRGSTKISACAALKADPNIASTAAPGRNVGPADITRGLTSIAMIDLPVFDMNDPGKTTVGVFANGSGSGWRRAALSIQRNDGLVEIGATAAPAIIGRSMSALAPHTPHLLDTTNNLDVELANEGIDFTQDPQNDAICWLGGEYLRFRSVVPLGNARFRLSELRRGCFGTEDAIGFHQSGEQFVLLEPDTVRLLEGVTIVPGSTITIEAIGIGDSAPVVSTLAVAGKSIAPLPPVHLGSRRLTNGGIDLVWIRRSRIDFGWNDGIDQASPEGFEQYNVALWFMNQVVDRWTTQQSSLSLSSTTVADLVAIAGSSLTFSVTQAGRYMQSAPATIQVIATP